MLSSVPLRFPLRRCAALSPGVPATTIGETGPRIRDVYETYMSINTYIHTYIYIHGRKQTEDKASLIHLKPSQA